MQEESVAAAHYCRNVNIPTLKVTTKGKGERRPSSHLKTVTLGTDDRVVLCIAFSPTQHTHFAAGLDGGRIGLWDVESGELISVPPVMHSDLVRLVMFSPDGEWVVSGSDDLTVRAWCITNNTSTVIATFQERVCSVAISFDNTTVVSTSYDCVIHICDLQGNVATTSQVPRCADPEANVVTMVFRPSSLADTSTKWLAAGWTNGLLHMWNITTGKPRVLAQLDAESAIFILVFTPDGTHLICGSYDGMISVRNPDDGSITPAVTSNCWSYDIETEVISSVVPESQACKTSHWPFGSCLHMLTLLPALEAIHDLSLVIAAAQQREVVSATASNSTEVCPVGGLCRVVASYTPIIPAEDP